MLAVTGLTLVAEPSARFFASRANILPPVVTETRRLMSASTPTAGTLSAQGQSERPPLVMQLIIDRGIVGFSSYVYQVETLTGY